MFFLGFSPDDKHKFVIDDAAAQVVRDIFHWFVQGGMSQNGIVKRLTGLGVPCPTAYKRQNGMNYHSPTLVGEPRWSASSVRAILQNRMYLGHMVQGKQKVKSYKVHTRVNLAEDAWFVKENTHEAIIDRERFEKAQDLMTRDTRSPPHTGKLYPFSGFLRCADCGRAMCRRPAKQLVYYACRTYITTGLCSRHSIRHDKLEGTVLAVLNQQISLMDDLDGLIDELNAAPVQQITFTRLEQALEQKKQALAKTQALHDGLYGDWKAGIITFEAFQRMQRKHEATQATLVRDIASLEEELRDSAQDANTNSPCLEAFRAQRKLTQLSRGMVVELIDVIHVHEGGGVEIQFNFADPINSLARFS